MPNTIETPFDLIEAMAAFEFPPATQARFVDLMARNNEGQLAPWERQDLRALVDLSERIAELRGRARLLIVQREGG